MRRTAMFCSLCAACLLATACGDDPIPIQTDKDTIPPNDVDTTLPDIEQGLPEYETPVTEEDVVPDTDEDIAPDVTPDADSGLIGKNCKLDGECGAPLICVNAKCAQGCDDDSDCSSYANTVCNKKLGRCLNADASSTACSEATCQSGCCYATKGFQDLVCTADATITVCGICKQGEIYMDGKTCVPAACKVGETKCRDYNSSDPRAKCFECSAASDYLCVDNPQCTPGSALIMVNVMECVPAGERCAPSDVCCSALPCIQGYCY